MSEEIRDDARRKVTSVGNSWIVCKSKSHPGRVYYFNTLTGEAAWNLSDAEIEKANYRTKHLECVPGAKPTRCPEPKDKPPSSPINISKPATHQFFNEPFEINRVSEQQSSGLKYSNFANNNRTFCTPLNQMSGIMQDTQINNHTSGEPICNLNSLNNAISTYNLNTAPSIYNPKVWDIPHTPQIFMAPTITPTVNHNSGSLSIAYNNLSQNVSQPVPGLFLNGCENANLSGIMTRGIRTFCPRKFNYGQGVQRNISKKNTFPNKTDLRQKLSSKRTFNRTPAGIPRGSGIIRTNPKNTDGAAHITTAEVERIHSNVLSDGTMESRCVEPQIHETSSKIDLAPLKSLAPSNSNSDAWFIVVDLDVLLNEFKFLNTLTDSDEKCHLMVPKRVLEDLKMYVTCSENIQARRILRFLSQQIEIGQSYTAEEPSNVEGDSMAEVIHTTCTELSDKKYHLILLTNNNELLTKNSSNINMFSIDEIKSLLVNNLNKQLVSPGPKKTFLLDELINKIKITVPNNTPKNIGTNSPVKDIEIDDHIADIPITQRKQNNTQDKIEQLKHTVDAGIQTDLEDINACISLLNVVEKQDLNAVPNNPPQNTKEVIKRSVSSVLNTPGRKREIKLKRSTSYTTQQPSVESEKKQFKWRRKRNTANQLNEQQNPSHSDKNTEDVESLHKNTLNIEISKQPVRILNNNPMPGSIENKILDDSIGSRESSIYADPKSSTTKENVTIEETSTSGIISNTESNVDPESDFSNSTINQQQLVYNGQTHNKPMYEVDSITMEEYLRMKCDEWISRFIQIMEEVLSQVLQQHPSFSDKTMPPPWALHEAAQCIAIKFCSHQDIKSAAYKLSSILLRVSDAKGKITMNMTPYQYMQMYSYGVHLLKAIMKVTTSCEDIQIAVESLYKLLHDIKNPNMDSSTHDTFNDNLQENLSNNDVSVHSDVPNNDDASSLHEQELPDSNEPKKRKFSEIHLEELQKPVKFIRNINIESSFFRSLSLQKSNVVNNSVTQMNNSVKSQVQSCEEQHSTHSSTKEGNNPLNASETAEKTTDLPILTNQPNIIRKFRICPELEEKVKSNYDDDLDYNEDYCDYTTEEYFSEDENYNMRRNDANGNETGMRANTNENHESKSLKEVDSLLANDNSKKFKYMMCTLLQEIRKALCQVRILCDQCYIELRNPERSTELKHELRNMAKRAHLHTVRLCRSLESMLDHETSNPTQSICNLLKQADVDICYVDSGLLFEYRITVAKCRDHADEFLNSIQNIISDFK